MVGADIHSVATVWQALLYFDDSYAHIIIQEVRWPRTLAAALVGAGLSVAGAILQGITRNPLASPGLLSINSGAAFAVVVLTVVTGEMSLSILPMFAALGAGLAALVVYLISLVGPGGATPIKLTLSGAVMTAFLTALTTSLLLFDHEALEKVRFWTAGTLSETDMSTVVAAAPYIIIGLCVAMTLGRSINLLALGEEVASSLGQNTVMVKVAALACSVLCAGGAVSMAGPVAFLGLLAPHSVRFLMPQSNYSWLLPFSAFSGACFMLLADIFARSVIQPQEIPVGVCTVLLGAPVFIYLARSSKVS